MTIATQKCDFIAKLSQAPAKAPAFGYPSPPPRPPLGFRAAKLSPVATAG